MIKVLIFEDNPKYQESLRLILEDADDICVVAAYKEANRALEKVKKHNPDVILMDIEMEDSIDGIEATAQITKACPDAKIMMLTILRDNQQIMAAIKAGARGYLVKGWPGEQIINSVRDSYQGKGMPVSPEVGAAMIGMLTPSEDAKFPPRHYNLSPREKEIICLMVNGRTPTEIVDTLKISKHTVNDHVKNIYKKLDVHSELEAVSIANKYRICDNK